MRVFTSYYSKMAKERENVVYVRISTSKPEWFPWDVVDMPELYPGWDLVNGIKDGTLSESDYKRLYNEKLNKLNRMDIVKKLIEISEDNRGKDVVLLCYEATNKFCHRHLVADWLNWEVIECV